MHFEVERASDSGNLPELLMKTAVDETWVFEMQSLALGLPWLPDLPPYTGLHSTDSARPLTHEDLSGLLTQELTEEPSAPSPRLQDPLRVLERRGETWKESLLAEWYSEAMRQILRSLELAHFNEGLKALASSLRNGDVKDLCTAVCDTAAKIGSEKKEIFVSFCPVAMDPRDMWKEPFSLILGVAEELPSKIFELRKIAARLRSFWESARDRSLSSPGPAGLFQCNVSIISVWPLRMAGGARTMQDPYLVQYSGGTSVVIMDVTLIKCRGRWSNASKTLGGPNLSDAACLRSIAAAHFASLEGPTPLMTVGRKDSLVLGTKEDLLSTLSPTWRSLALELPSMASGKVAIGAFGAWWPVLKVLWAEAGAILGCATSSAKMIEPCLWATFGRLADELRPWEDYVGSDSTRLLSASFLLGWFSMKQVVYCDEWEDEETAELHCNCGIPLDPRDSSQAPRLRPGAVLAAEAFLEVLAEIVLAGEPSNLQKLYSGVMANEDWQVLLSCLLQAGQQLDSRW